MSVKMPTFVVALFAAAIYIIYFVQPGMNRPWWKWLLFVGSAGYVIGYFYFLVYGF